MKVFELFESFLAEDRAQFIVDKFGDKLVAANEKDHAHVRSPEELVNQLKDKCDPTGGKYLQFLVNMYIKGQFKLEDMPRIKKDLTVFDKAKAKIKKDILSFKTLNDLYDAVEPYYDADLTSNKAKVKMTKKDADTLIDTPDFKVIVPKTKEAAKLYGANTKWCTAADDDEHNMFDHYNAQGPLYVIIAGGKKFQLHYESGQFMNDRDQELSPAQITYLSKFPEYKQFLNMLIHKHYSKYLED